jgi:hypothetical protein
VAEVAVEAAALGFRSYTPISQKATKPTKQKVTAFSRPTSFKKIPYIITNLNLFVKIH